jgi:hypothetical protein
VSKVLLSALQSFQHAGQGSYFFHQSLLSALHGAMLVLMQKVETAKTEIAKSKGT